MLTVLTYRGEEQYCGKHAGIILESSRKVVIIEEEWGCSNNNSDVQGGGGRLMHVWLMLTVH